MKPAIKVTGLSKSYSISHNLKPEYATIKDSFDNFIKKPFRKRPDESHETFWALNDVNFEIQKGEIFGVIGRNGSGKSTLLKILSRTVQPTKGEITMHGRVASLLEVGTGFHPELTGRENIFFNGSMLGMSKKEILKKFDEIVAFSEVEKFIDTPVKFYSSGMYVRLAFSVAAHLNPDILILDEVLAVGDVNFQQKSLNKIKSIMEDGTTVIFVSHSMASVQQLCNRGILLDSGKIIFEGNTEDLAQKYSDIMRPLLTKNVLEHSWDNDGSVKNDYFIPSKIYLTDTNGKKITSSARNDIDKWITIEGNVKEESDLLNIGCAIYSPSKVLMFMSYPTDETKEQSLMLKKGKIKMKAKLPAHILNDGIYKVSLVGGIHNKFWIFEPGTDSPSIEIEIEGGLSESPLWKAPREGNLALILNWEVDKK